MQSNSPNQIVDQYAEHLSASEVEGQTLLQVASKLNESDNLRCYAEELLDNDDPVGSIIWAMAIGIRAAQSKPQLQLIPGGKARVLQFPAVQH